MGLLLHVRRHLGFAVPLRLRTSRGELRLLTTVTTFATAVDVTLAELKLEAFLPADQATAEALLQAGTMAPRAPTPAAAARRRPSPRPALKTAPGGGN